MDLRVPSDSVIVNHDSVGIVENMEEIRPIDESGAPNNGLHENNEPFSPACFFWLFGCFSSNEKSTAWFKIFNFNTYSLYIRISFWIKKRFVFCEIILKILLAMRSVNQHAFKICGIILFWLYFSDCHSFMWFRYLLCFSRNPHYSKLIYSYQREYLKKFDEAGPYIKKIFWTLEKSNYVFRSHWWIYDIWAKSKSLERFTILRVILAQGPC